MSISTLKQQYLALPHLTHVLIWLVAGLVLSGILIVVIGRVRDAWQLHEYNKVRTADIQKAQVAEQLAQQAVGQAKQKDNESKAWEAKAAELEKQRDLALQALANSSETANQKRQAYESIRNRPIPVVVTSDQSIDDLCKSAAAHGISCN